VRLSTAHPLETKNTPEAAAFSWGVLQANSVSPTHSPPNDMKIFLSHSSRDKALIREIRRQMPEYLNTWLDEQHLLVGQNVEQSISSAIKEAGFVIIFLSGDAVRSQWVKKELHLALEHEKTIGREFVLPVLLENVWHEVEPREFQERKYLKCFDQNETDVKFLSQELTEQINKLLATHLSAESLTKLKEKEQVAEQVAVINALGQGVSSNFNAGKTAVREKLLDFMRPFPKVPHELRLTRLKTKVSELLLACAKPEEKESSSPRKRSKSSKTSEGGESNAALRTLFGKAYDNGQRDVLIKIDEQLRFWGENKDILPAEEVWNEISNVLHCLPSGDTTKV
jgi:hypothetical protein